MSAFVDERARLIVSHHERVPLHQQRRVHISLSRPMVSDPTIFQLAPLPDLDARPFTYIDLPTIQPGWDLPPLDENAAGSDRLLQSLEAANAACSQTTPSRKGKEREGPTSSPMVAPPSIAEAFVLDWERMVGGSDVDERPGKVFKVSCHHSHPSYVLTTGSAHMGRPRRAAQRDRRSDVGASSLVRCIGDEVSFGSWLANNRTHW